MPKEVLRFAARALPFIALSGVLFFTDPSDLWDGSAEAGERGHAFPELGPLESDAQHLLNMLAGEDRQLTALENAFNTAGVPRTDPLMQRLAALNRSQDLLFDSVAQLKAQLAVADMSGTFNGSAKVVRDTLTQLRIESLGLSSDIDALERDARARGIIR